MKLKEAQVLGILAFIAAGIIVLCMWGGGRKHEVVSPQQNVQAEDEGATNVDELLAKLRTQQPDGGGGASAVNPPVTPAPTGVPPAPPAPIGVPPAPPIGPAQPAAIEPAAPKTHVVQRGETLSSISRQYYNTPGKWKIIWEANKQVIGRRPEDLRPKMKLVIPPLAEAEHGQVVPNVLEPGTSDVVWAGQNPTLSAQEPASGTKHYDVQRGDTLWKIAQKFYGDGNAWKKIQEANQGVSPNDLREGMQLTLP